MINIYGRKTCQIIWTDGSSNIYESRELARRARRIHSKSEPKDGHVRIIILKQNEN